MSKNKAEYAYFKATHELLSFKKELESEKLKVMEKVLEFVARVGGKEAVSSGASVVGVHFESTPPEGWKHVPGSKKWENYFSPCVSKGHRNLLDEMQEFRIPGGRTFLNC